jgi:hypothetical protein
MNKMHSKKIAAYEFAGAGMFVLTVTVKYPLGVQRRITG